MSKFVSFASAGSADRAWTSTVLVRILVGWVFILAGLRKFMEPATMGTGRFAEMGFPAAGFLGPWVGFWELVGGALVLIGLWTRAATIPLIVTMVVAIWTTKVPNFSDDSLVAALHSVRLDTTLLLGSLFLLFAGSGRFAVDSTLRSKDRQGQRLD